MQHLQSALGVVALLAFAWAIRERRGAVNWRSAGAALAVTFVTALLLLEVPQIKTAFALVNRAVGAIADATQAGTSFAFGYIGGGPLPFALTTPGAEFVLAFQALPIVLVMSVMTTLLFHWRILPPVVRGFSWALERTMGVGGAVGLSTAANIFLGMVELPLFIRPYLARLTRGELFMVMTGGMAGIAGTVFVLYATILSKAIPDVAGHILVASILGAPAALLISMLMVPDPPGEQTDIGTVEIGRVADGTMDAIVRGTAAGLELLLNIVAMLIVLVALVHLANAILGLLPDVAGSAVTLQRLLGLAMAPVCWLMGVPWSQAVTAGSPDGHQDRAQRADRLSRARQAAGRRARSALAPDHALCHVWLRQFRLARHHDRGLKRDGAGAARRHHLARRQIDRLGHAHYLPAGRDCGGVELDVPPDSSAGIADRGKFFCHRSHSSHRRLRRQHDRRLAGATQGRLSGAVAGGAEKEGLRRRGRPMPASMAARLSMPCCTSTTRLGPARTSPSSNSAPMICASAFR